MKNEAAIALRRWREDDLPFLMRLRNDVALQALLLATARGSDPDAVRAWAIRKDTGEGRLFRVIAAAGDGRPLGFVQAERTNDDDRRWRFGIGLDWPHQGAGHGRAALMLLEALVAERGGDGLELIVDRSNGRAISCYRALGYAENDAMPRSGPESGRVEVNGEMRSVIAMSKRIAAPVSAA